MLENVLLFLITSAACLVGAYAKEYHRQWEDCAARIVAKKIFVAAATATLVAFGFSDDLLARFGLKGYPMSCFFIGLVGFELLERMSHLDSLLTVVNDYLFKRGGSNK